ncbi:ribosomal protein L11 methyltransferase [Constrictibacter sp. MBR-5]|jgi:ribosomal protein L11 methyltransferase|uniref:50S ribosomal protein L11 methyltransferase n=1 Tax=Constrictibacter sp. MBR-5 TaxID=3156467 RepID=UPI003397CA53
MWRVAVTVPAGAAETFAWALEPFADTVGIFGIEDDRRSPDPPTWETDLWLADRCVVEIVSEDEPDRPGIVAAIAVSAAERGIPRPEITFEELADRDWVAETYRGFPELTIGRYRIRGSHIDTPVPPNAITLTIDAAVAFGTGEHETTRGCLTALDRLARRIRPHRVLDLGCGSGILALAAARTWHVPVVASDIDPVSVRETRRNARVNGLLPLVEAIRSPGWRAPAVRSGGPYDLVFANILARPLVRMAPDLAHGLAPGGVAVLSGLLTWQEARVLSAHRTQGLRLVERFRFGDWSTLVVSR